MRVEISSAALTRIQDDAAASGHEVCGLLLGEAMRITGVAACRNVAADPARAFEIDPAALFAAHRAARAGGPRIVGHYHSHPRGPASPSDRDAAAAVEVGTLWLIVARDATRAWRTVAPGRFEEVLLDIGGCAAAVRASQGPRNPWEQPSE